MVSSWESYPKKHMDPDVKKNMAGTGSDSGQRASFNYGHAMNYNTQMSDDMKLAMGAAKGRDLKAEAQERKEMKDKARSSCTKWSIDVPGAPDVDYSQVGAMPNIVWDKDHRSPNMKGDYYHRPRPYRYDEEGICASRTTMLDCMDGGLDPTDGAGAKSPTYKDFDPRELKMKLSRNVHTEGDGNWYGYSKRHVKDPGFPSPRDKKEKDSHYKSQVGDVLFPPRNGRIFGTTMRDCMASGVTKGKAFSTVGAGSKPSYPRVGLDYDYEPMSLAMPTHFEQYKGGKIAGEAMLPSSQLDQWVRQDKPDQRGAAGTSSRGTTASERPF